MTDSKGKLFAQSLAGAFYGMGASLAGTDPTGLAVQLQANRERRMRREQLEGAKAALLAADETRYKKFMSKMPEGFEFQDLETFGTMWQNFVVTEENSRIEADAAAVLPVLQKRLQDDFNVDVSDIMDTNMSARGKEAELRARVEKYEDRELERQERERALGAVYEGTSTESLVDQAEYIGIEGAANLDRGKLISALAAAGHNPTAAGSGNSLQITDPAD